MIRDISQLVGKTPLIKLSEKLYAKFETYNPSGSIKDRMVSYIIDTGSRKIGAEWGRDGVDADGKFIAYLKNAYVDWSCKNGGLLSLGLIGALSIVRF